MALTYFFPNLIFHYLIIYSLICFTPSESIGFTLGLIPRFSPESPLYPGKITFEEEVEKSIEVSVSRVHYMDYLSTQESSLSTNNIRLMIRPDGYYYTTKVNLGTPVSTQALMVDTGSELLWTQCKPCVNCYNQSMPIFDPAQSATYKKVPCDDPICRGHRCIDGQCKFWVNYAGGAVTQGFVSRESFTFESNQGPVTVPNIVFGCGNDQQGFLLDRREISGILGINLGRDSLISQMFNRIEGQFSYCLVYAAGHMIGSSPLRFGEDAVLPPRPDIQTISIIRPQGYINYKSYYVKLIDVSVGDKTIGFPPGTFDLSVETGLGGCIFDSGASGMYFDVGPYETVMKEFDEHFKSFKLERVYNVSESLKYCYKYHPAFRAYVSMTLHFENANYVAAPTYQYFHFDRRGYFCVAVMLFPGKSKKTVIGAWQQQDMRFLFDLNNNLIRFAPENCAADKF